jgi:hypothetical protein
MFGQFSLSTFENLSFKHKKLNILAKYSLLNSVSIIAKIWGKCAILLADVNFF